MLREFTSKGKEFTPGTPLIMLNEFLSMFFFSFLIGALVGCLSAYLLKYFKKNGIILNRVQEISVLILCAFFSYELTEELELSPIISMLFCGLFMSNYAFYNLSFQAREESSVVSRMLSNFAEAFVFTYLGLTLIYYMTHSLSISFILIELVIVIFGRIVAIFGLSFVMQLCGVKSFKLKTSQKGIMSCAGSIRGAIAFGLAISIDTSNKKNKEVLISSTLILVFFTTIVFGALMPFMINIMKKLDPKEETELINLEQNQNEEGMEEEKLESNVFNFMHPNFIDKYEGSKEKNFDILKNRLSYWLGHYWFEFDEMYLKPRLCYLWPYVRDDNMNLKKVILSSCIKYEEEQSVIDKESYGHDRAYYESFSNRRDKMDINNMSKNISHNERYNPPLLKEKLKEKEKEQGLFEMSEVNN
ncbi:MAG: cation:proton antiporter, partial [archaeon]|nr:cation:proton antiporter [archaeon]